jgi:hypothetical protein
MIVAEMQKQKGMRGFGKMGADYESKPKPGKDGASDGGEQHGESESQTVITHHGDGTHSVDGEKHPDHMHAGAAVLHKMSGGDKHHILHHDGMSAHSHMVHESGEHEDGGEHNTADEAKQSLDKFFNEGEGLAARIDWSTAKVQEKLAEYNLTMEAVGEANVGDGAREQ